MPQLGNNANHDETPAQQRRDRRRRKAWKPVDAVERPGRHLAAVPDSVEPPLRNEVVQGVRSLAQQVRALQDRYEQEHRRLADTLAFLTVQSRDLEQQLVAFGQLASTLEQNLGIAGGGEPLPPARSVESPAVPELYVRCLGGFSVSYQGRTVDLGTSRKGRLLFKYLAARAPGRRASKELLAEVLWPDAPLDRALVSLQTGVHQLRRAMGAAEGDLARTPAIVYFDDQYGLNPAISTETDVELFHRCLEQGRQQDAANQAASAGQAYALALEAYGGELLPEERYEEWVEEERRMLEEQRLEILARLLRIGLEQGTYQEAVLFGRRLLETDPTREDVYRDLMRCYSRLGQRIEALRQYRRCQDQLRVDLDLEPEAETSVLAEQLARGEAI
jgi:DNA-binding SARP family transcriptional activator